MTQSGIMFLFFLIANNVANSNAFLPSRATYLIPSQPGSNIRSVRSGSPILKMGLFDGIKNKMDGISNPFEEATALGKGMSFLKVQVALTCDDRSPTSILGIMSAKAENANTNSARGLAILVSDICVALLRKSDDWVAGCSETKIFQGNDAEGKAESFFNKQANREVAKFEKEYFPPMAERDGPSTLVVVSLLCAIRGDRTATFGNVGGDRRALREALETVSADVMTERGELLVAAEILWTPSDPEETLTRRDMIMDYPELMDV